MNKIYPRVCTIHVLKIYECIVYIVYALYVYHVRVHSILERYTRVYTYYTCIMWGSGARIITPLRIRHAVPQNFNEMAPLLSETKIKMMRKVMIFECKRSIHVGIIQIILQVNLFCLFPILSNNLHLL